MVERFLAERDDFVAVPVKEIWGRERAETLGDGMTLRLFPHVTTPTASSRRCCAACA